LSASDIPSKTRPWQRTWFRLYVEILNDPKIQRLQPALHKIWINLLCVAALHDGALPPIADLAFNIRLTEKDAAKAVEQLIAAGLLDRDGEVLRPHNWDGRQPQSDTSTARVQRHRKQLEGAKAVSGNGTKPFHETESEANRNGRNPSQETAGNVAGNGLDSESDSDQEKDTESSSSSAAVHAAEDGLPEKLRQAAGGHVALRCGDVGPIRELIAKGCDLQLDVLPVVRSRVPALKKPLSTWRAAWLGKEILASRDARRERTSAGAPSTISRTGELKARSARQSIPAATIATTPKAADWRTLGEAIGGVISTAPSPAVGVALDARPAAASVGQTP
jgi:hypothetical protein